MVHVDSNADSKDVKVPREFPLLLPPHRQGHELQHLVVPALFGQSRGDIDRVLVEASRCLFARRLMNGGSSRIASKILYVEDVVADLVD